MDKLAAALEALYTAAPEDFVATRKELASALSAAAAKQLKAQKKPTQIAYLLNQLARRESRAVAALADVGRTLARAQRAAIRSGDSSGLRDAIAAQRKAMSVLVRKAGALAKELEVHVGAHALSGALQAAVADPAVADALEAGQLAQAPEAESSFGGMDLSDALAASTKAKAADPPTKARAPTKRAGAATKRSHATTTQAAARARAKAARTKQAEREKTAKAKATRERAAAARAEREARAMVARAEKAARVAQRAEARATALEEKAAEARGLAEETRKAAEQWAARAEKKARTLA